MGRFVFRYRDALFPAVFVAAALLAPPSHLLGHPEWDRIAVVLGVLVALLGETVRCLTIGLVYIKRGGRDRRVYADTLITEGIYAHTRNPMYFGNLLIAGGVSLLFGSLWVTAAVIPLFALIYQAIMLEEEGYLREKFGEGYQAYVETTPRLLPRWKGLGATLAQHRFEWQRLLFREYGTLFGLLAGMCLLLQWKILRMRGPEAWRAQAAVPAVFLAVLVVAYGAARGYKKRTRRRARALREQRPSPDPDPGGIPPPPTGSPSG